MFMRKQFVVALAIAAIGLVPVAAQDKPVPAAAPPAASSGARQIPLKVQLTLMRFMGEKKIMSVPYMLGVLTNAQKTSLRMGVQVPVVQTVFGAKSDAGSSVPQSSYTYRDVGTNIDCQAQDVGNGLFSLVITVEDSTLQLDRPAEAADEKKITRDIPAFRSFRASFAILLRDGQTMQYASATDPISGEVMRIEVALSLAK
jgi:hypothetical protein